MIGLHMPRFGIFCPPAAVYSKPPHDALVSYIGISRNNPGGATESLAPESTPAFSLEVENEGS